MVVVQLPNTMVWFPDSYNSYKVGVSVEVEKWYSKVTRPKMKSDDLV